MMDVVFYLMLAVSWNVADHLSCFPVDWNRPAVLSRRALTLVFGAVPFAVFGACASEF